MQPNLLKQTKLVFSAVPKAYRKGVMSRAEVSLKLLVGMIAGTEFVGSPVLLALGVFFDVSLVQSPTFSACWMLVWAIVGAVLGLKLLPRFSRDRGRIADFLIDPKHIRCSLGYAFPPKR